MNYLLLFTVLFLTVAAEGERKVGALHKVRCRRKDLSLLTGFSSISR